MSIVIRKYFKRSCNQQIFKKTGFNEYTSDFSVDYDIINNSNFINIH